MADEDRLWGDISEQLDEVAATLLKHRILWLQGPITTPASALLSQQLLALEFHSKEPIKLFISSAGGDDYAMWELIDLIGFINSPVDTYAIGLCASAAAALYLAGRKRYAFPHSYFMIHAGEAESPRGGPAAISTFSKQYQKEYEDYISYIAERIGKRPSAVKTMLEKGDAWFTATAAMKAGIVHKVLTGLRRTRLMRRGEGGR